CSRHPRHLHSIPTRRSSDLGKTQQTMRGLKNIPGGIVLVELDLDTRQGCKALRPRPSTQHTHGLNNSLACSFVELAIISSCINRSEEHTSELQSRFDLVCRL